MTLPEVLRGRHQWVRWRIESTEPGRAPTKIPYDCNGGRRASSVDSTTWGSFSDAVAALAKAPGDFDGIGFVFTADDDLCGVDLDGCLADGELKPEAAEIVRRFDTYTEVSPSGTGVKLFLCGRLPAGCGHKRPARTFAHVEAYDRGRYFTVTGRRLEGTPTEVQPRQEALDWLVATYLAPRAKAAPPANLAPNASGDRVQRCRAYLAKCPDAISGQGGHDATFRAACECFRFGLSDAEAAEVMAWYNQSKCSPPWSERELTHKLESARRNVEQAGEFGSRATATDIRAPRPRSAPSAASTDRADVSRMPTDIGNAARFVEQHGQSVRYSFTSACWYVWDGRRWGRDASGRVVELAKRTALRIFDEARDAESEGRREELAKHAIRSQKRERLAAMIDLARPDVAVTSGQLDASPWLFNCLNGTVDLQTGELRPHDPADLITRLAPVEYDPDARHPAWERLLNDATGGNAEVLAFLRRAVGYSLTGDVSEEVLFFIHGPGAAGKSTFLEAIKATMGEYSLTADFDTFLERNGANGPRNDIARLDGARFVTSVEVSDGRHLAQGLVKMLTGGDRISARLLYREAVEFTPSFKLWLAANHAPRVDDRDDALWRRIIRIPFDRAVPKEKRDPSIKATLTSDPAARAAVLAWAVAGCLEWQALRLQVPVVLEQATEEYRADQDPLREFFSQACVFGAGYQATAAELRRAYLRYAHNVGLRNLLSPKAFAERLKDRGCVNGHERRGAVWTGIGLLNCIEDGAM